MAVKILVPLVAVIVYFVFHPRLQFGDQKKTVYNHVPGACHAVEGVVHGSEDIVRTRDGLAFISTGVRPAPVITPDPWFLQGVGKILLFDFKNPGGGVREVRIDPEEKSEGLEPHGLSLYENPDSGEIRLFVVNHHKFGDQKMTVYNHVPGACHAVEGVVHGSEDIVRTRDGLAFISTGVRPAPVITPDPWFLQGVGKILLFDFMNPGDGVREVRIEPEEKSEGLEPHGLSLYENQESGEIRLFVLTSFVSGVGSRRDPGQQDTRRHQEED
ncbi:PON3 [Branchiostoma lanceolatum]|uniref:PON3 protein n=1 Tax=Branchiostoma lanceolatum TaxID=7740 RepID=A0A8J9ZEQ7_BRALA|nr:PON3 [Branchiostoma lanceolatum]